MSIRVALNHKTSYRYDRDVSLSPQVVRLRPAPHCRTPIHGYSLKITPEPHFINWQQDPYSNYLARIVFPETTREFVVEVDLIAEMTVINPFDFFVEDYASKFPFKYEPVVGKELLPYLETLLPGDGTGYLFKKLVERFKPHGVNTIDYVVEINRSLQHLIRYVIRLEPGIQTCEQTLELASGSCRDSAWLLVQLFRHLGLAARFVSGYLIQLTPDVKSLDGPSGTSVDFTDLHAWAEVYLPGAGWVGLDPTSGLLVAEGHIPLACSADPITAAPITGSYSWLPADKNDKIKETFGFHMSVDRVLETPRVTKPYTEEQWAAIEALGNKVDQDLIAGDVRLTMGGEPTFVSIDDMEGAEWNTTAVGPNKRKLAGDLIKRLKRQFSKGGLLHYGQGKQYPGEPLPRWALSVYWRKDGDPIWFDESLFADEKIPYKYNEEHAKRFISELAKRLRVEPNFAIPGYEDAFYYLWKERRLPVNVDPFDSKLENELDRERLATVFEQGLNKVIGYALPVRREFTSTGPTWFSGPWFQRSERMYLIPGDSPMGFRLPLDSLPWVVPSDFPHVYEPDPFDPRPPLPKSADARQKYETSSTPNVAPSDWMEQVIRDLPKGVAPEEAMRWTLQKGKSASWMIRTALCVEAREGRLHVFLPPVRYLEDYLDLIHAVEATAWTQKTPIVIEGYAPPHDPRLNHIKVTPDPGVIEVNIHPANSWDELVKNTTVLYDEARLSRLGTEKFMLDGRHTGTGGGNHIVVGGPSPADSPFLRRPDVLRSLIAYWHNHPSLSYLFSGTFVGPTSQAPRVDEARHDSVYELEIAFKQIPDPIPGSSNTGTPPWLTDRILRNLLIDVSGNTHRAEFCIDKLYSPDSSSGRLGLVEFRAFEMPPHARMSLAQQLLMRALIARFWKQPYNPRLVRWGTELHDRFMLPHFVAQDFEDVILDTQKAGYQLKPEWFNSHLEFRFPVYGSIESRGLVVELRQAIEPWNVMGEEPAGGSTVRFVDSSLERLQVKVDGMTDPRHVITVNSKQVPLHPTGTNGQFVAGVRYRAWQPPSCLHPTIGTHVPLVFDVYDTWTGRAIGGCTYHVAHPGGRGYDVFPVNAYEAEGRRISRFTKFGHTPGRPIILPRMNNRDFPFTLDLRRD